MATHHLRLVTRESGVAARPLSSARRSAAFSVAS